MLLSRKNTLAFSLFLFIQFPLAKSQSVHYALDTAQVHTNLYGHLGEAITRCINKRVLAEEPAYLVAPFKQHNETRFWQTEFWGKWMLSLTDAYKYAPSAELKQKMDEGVTGLIATQRADGYIGNYADSAHLQQWDVWGRKYCMLGLLHYYDVTHNTSALTAAKKIADHLMTEVGPGKVNIVTTGNFRGMASSSILEPILLLYLRTKDEKYLNFGKYIVTQWETPGGPQLISKAIQKIPVSERFRTNNWWSWENGQKAYEMMSCYDGLLDLYMITGNKDYLLVVKNVAQDIMSEEINVAGSGSAYECWYHGKTMQTQAAYHTMETCVTQTWMKLCFNLYRVTGESRYADELELSGYNALLSSLTPDGATFAQYSPLEGYRYTGELQCGMNISCCIANGPRGLLLLPSLAAVTAPGNIVYLNLYTNADMNATLQNGNRIHIKQETNYPVTDSVSFTVDATNSSEATIALRIPNWSTSSSITINGLAMDAPKAGSYALIKRSWAKGDKITLKLDMHGRVIHNGQFVAIMRGPIVLARDSRFGDSYPDEVALPIEKSGVIALKPIEHNSNMWMAFSAPFIRGIDLKNAGGVVQLPLTDLSSAGSDWDKTTRFRTWIPLPLDVKEIGAGK